MRRNLKPVAFAMLGVFFLSLFVPLALAVGTVNLVPTSTVFQTGNQTWTVSENVRATAVRLDDWTVVWSKDTAKYGRVSTAYVNASTAFGRGPAYTRERARNAALIISIGKKRGFSDYSIAIAIATAIQESSLLNLDWGDADSMGLYQQRPSVRAWGTAKQILNPSHAINQFYDRLAGIRNRDSRSMKSVAMQIQVPNPFYYNRDWKWDRAAMMIVKDYVGA